jgi:hypothetical protein
LNPEEVKKPNGPVELDQEIDVAARPRIAARDRAEEIQRLHTEVFQLGAMLVKSSQCFLARHGGDDKSAEALETSVTAQTCPGRLCMAWRRAALGAAGRSTIPLTFFKAAALRLTRRLDEAHSTWLSLFLTLVIMAAS